jgi:phosphohistidine phosphatase
MQGEDKHPTPWHNARTMRQLLLLRHAKSSWDDAAMPDRDRPLNARGRQAASTMRAAIQDLGLLPDMILVSPALRTMQTLQALEPWDETPLIEPTEGLYLADPTQILAALHGVPETVRSVMVIGHNPGLHDLALSLAGTLPAGPAGQSLQQGFPTAALAEFTIAGTWWDLRTGGGRLVRFLTPKTLEAAG